MRFFQKFKLLTLLSFLATSSSALLSFQATAAESKNKHVYIGGLYGSHKVGTSDSKLTAMGGNFGYRAKDFGAGFFYIQGEKSTSLLRGTASAKVENTLYGLEPKFIFGTKVGGFVGLKMGQSKLTLSATAGGRTASVSSTGLAVGPSAGIDYKIIPNLALGLEGSYLTVDGDGASYKVTLFLGSLTLWL